MQGKVGGYQAFSWVLILIASNSNSLVFGMGTSAHISSPDFTHMKKFVSMQRGCGRMKNRLLTSTDGERYCARYRDNIELLQGEYFTYLSAQLLGITMVPVVNVVEVDSSSSTWSSVWEEVEKAGWKPKSVVTLTKWVDSLQPVVVPTCIKLSSCCNSNNYKNTTAEQKTSMMYQWSDLIVLDYVTGNVDRLSSHLYNERWDAKSLNRPVHNLAVNKHGVLVALDNECGFQHSYRILDTYQHFHERLLSSVCSLRDHTKIQLTKLLSSDDLHGEFRKFSTHHDLLPMLPDNALMLFKERLKRVLESLRFN